MYASGYLLVRFNKTSMLLKRFTHFSTYTNRTNRINKKFSQPQVTSENVHKNTMLFEVIATAGRQQTCLPRWRKELAARIKGDVLSRLDGAVFSVEFLVNFFIASL